MEYDKKSIGWLVTTNVYGARHGIVGALYVMSGKISSHDFRRQVAIAMNTRRFEEPIHRMHRITEFELENA